MKNYLSAIEQILGTSLDPDSINNYEFSASTLGALRDFASGYSKIRLNPPDDISQISCFMPFPDILSGNFRTYRTDGSLEGHWPEFEDLANTLLVCDRVIIHDHLEHYAASAINGYSVNHRYNGLRNWLTVLAEWKPLIIRNIICVLPQYLALAGPMQKAWDEGTIHDTASEIYYKMYPEEGYIKSGYEAEELLSGFSEIEDLLSTLSIPGNLGGKYAPFFNNPDPMWLHEVLTEGVFNGNIARLCLDAVFTSHDYGPADVCRYQVENEVFHTTNEIMKTAVRKFSENSSFLADPFTNFQPYLNQVSIGLNDLLAFLKKSTQTQNESPKRLTIGFAGMITGSNTDKYLKPGFAAVRSIFNNLPVKAQLPGSTHHYFIAFTQAKKSRPVLL